VALSDDDIDASRHEEGVTPPVPGFRELRIVGRGGFGDVYRAEPEGGGSAVAIKIARGDRPSASVALRREVEVMAAIGPPHVPTVRTQGTLDDGRAYVAMELLESPTLAARLSADVTPLPLADACELTIAVLQALATVHACGWVHRDLKPENIFVDAEGHATLVDFGLVAHTRVGAASGDGDGMGTAEYMAPEQCEGRNDGDVRSDLYAVGVILFELITGRPPFWGPRAVVQEGHRSRRPPRLAAMAGGRSIPAGLEDVVARCLAKDPRDRFPDAGALRTALERAADALAEPAPGSDGARRQPTPANVAPRPGGEARARTERVTAGLLFFESDTDVATVQARVVALGGQMAHGGAGRFVAVFGQDLAQNPARQALRAAEELLAGGLCQRARLDLAPVAVQSRRDGTTRFVSPLFTRSTVYPSPADPPGVSLSASAATVLPSAEGGATSAPHLSRNAPAPTVNSSDDPTLTAEINAWPLLGRDGLLDALVASARAAQTERRPTAVSLVGDAGHGKSHLFRVLADRLTALGTAEVLELRAREPALGDVDHTLSELLRRGLALPAVPPSDGAELLHRRLDPGGAELAPAVALALGWLGAGPASAAMATALRTLSAAPGALRGALTVAAGDGLRRRAQVRPLIVILDDAHFASDVVLSALEYASLAEHDAPIWLCAIGRPTFAAERPTWGERAGRREAHTLGPLDRESAAALCRRLLLPVESVPDSAVQRLLERAESVPLLLVELIRGLQRQGIVRKSPKGEGYYLATDELDLLPDLPLIEWLARGELDALAPTLREHARLIALLGSGVTNAEVEGVIRRLEQQGGGADAPLDARIGTRRLIATGMGVEDREGRVGFRHELVREAIARATPEALCHRIHFAAATYYAEVSASSTEERHLAQLAYHGSAAGMGAVAERAYLELAERTRARHAYTEAERLYSRALEQPSAAAERGAAYRGRGLMRYRIGRYHDALADFSCARTMAADVGDVAAQIELLLDEATAFDWMDEYQSSEDRVLEARALMATASSPLLEAGLLLGQGRSALRFSRNEEAAMLLERCAWSAETIGADGYETLVVALLLLGFVLPGIGRLAEARRVLDQVITLCEAHGDRVHLAGALNTSALCWACLGEKARLSTDMARALTLARELGQGTLEFLAEFNLGEALLMMDDVDAAEPHIRRAIALDRRLSGDPVRPLVLLLEARLALHRGDQGVARQIVDRLRRRMLEAQARGDTHGLLVPGEHIACDMLSLATRDATVAEWDELEMRSERFSFGQERIEIIEARAAACTRHGRNDEARRHLDRAVALATTTPGYILPRLRRKIKELTDT
jgi:tetratricopeptide (TPR) repeat protein